jgi:hypothetical protein
MTTDNKRLLCMVLCIAVAFLIGSALMLTAIEYLNITVHDLTVGCK